MSASASDDRGELAASFTHRGVAAAYRHRPPYPAEVFDLLGRLITDRPGTVLDLGAGDGALARPLAARVDQVDAVDPSAAMVRAGRRRPGGSRPNLRWIIGTAETAGLAGPYALVTAAASLHWMSWPLVLPRVAAAMTPGAFLAVVEHGPVDMPWRDDLDRIIATHSRSRHYDPRFSVAAALGERGLFTLAGRASTAPVVFRQSVRDYAEHFHSTASLARELMPGAEAAAFRSAVRRLVAPFARDGMLAMTVVAEVAWGRLAPERDPRA